MITLLLVLMALSAFVGGFMTYGVIHIVRKRLNKFMFERKYVKAMKELNKVK